MVGRLKNVAARHDNMLIPLQVLEVQLFKAGTWKTSAAARTKIP